MISEPQRGLARSFSCGTCANLCGHANLYPDSSATFPIATTGQLGNATFQECLSTCGHCGGTAQGPIDEIPVWSSSDTSIASLSSGLHSLTADFLGEGPGSSFGRVSATEEGCTASGSGPITVVSATLSQRTTGQVSSDDAAMSNYQMYEGTLNLGPIIGSGLEGNGCFIGDEVIGALLPATYTGNVVLGRLILNDASYTNLTQTGTTSNQDDTSSATFQDDNPHSGTSNGKVYDLDAPGIVINVYGDGNVYRYRGNFYAYATLPDGTRISPYYNYFVRVSCNNTASGAQFDNTLPGDNTIQMGTTLTTWNFQ